MSSGGQFEKYHSFENFVELHSPQLVSLGVPRKLWETLYKKLYQEVYDVDESLEVQYVEDEGFQLAVKAKKS